MVSFRLSSSPPSCRRGRILKVESSMRGRSHEATSTSTSLIYEDSRETTPSMYPGEEQLSSSSHNDFKCITSSSSSGCTYTRDSDEDLCRKHLLLHGKPTFHAKACQERSSSLASTFHFFPSSFLFSSSLGTSKMKSSSFSCTLFVFSSIFFLLFFLFSSSSSSSSSLSSIFLPSSLVILISKQHSLFPSSSLPSFLLASASSPPSASIEEQLEEKYTPRNCKYRPLPKNLNEFAYLSYNGEITIGDVFGLPASSIHHEQRISFSLSSSPSSSSSQRRAILSVSVEMHRDNVTEFNHLELYKRKKGEKPHPSLSAAEAASAADGMGAMQSALRKQQALAIGKRVEGAGGPRTKVVLSSALSDEAGDLVFDLVFSFRDSFGRTAVGEGEESNIYSPLLPCFPVRLDLSLVPVDRMPLHIPANCPEESSLPSQNGLTQKLGDASFTSSNSPEMPYVFVFRNLAPWSPYSLAVWHTTIEVPRRLHRFARLFFRLSFRFLSGPLQLVLELFDEKALPDATATRPQCLLGCMGGTPTYNGQLFDHAMPTGFTYKIWILAGEPMFLEDHSTQCIQFDFEYKVDYEARLTPFEVGSHSWNCKFARLPGEIHQIDESMVVLSRKEGGVGSSPGKKEEGVGAVHARSLDLKDWFGFPPDEVDEMIHFINLHIKEVSDVRLSLFETRLRLRTALTTGGTPENVDSMRAVCDEKTFGGDSSGMVELHCRVSPGEYRLALYAEYPLGGLPPCDGFYMHLTIKPVSLLNERYSCRYRDNGMNGGLSYPPLLISPSTPPPLAIPQPSDTVIDLGPLELGKEEENFRVFMYKLTPPPSGVESSFISIARSRFSVQKSLTQVYVHIAVLSDFAAVDVSAIIRKEGENAEDSPDKTGNYYPLSFSSSYQHLVGPLDAGEYVAELLALSPQTIDQNAANAVHELCVPFSIDLRLVGRGGDNLHSSTWLCNHETPHLPRYIRGEAGVEMTLDKQFLLPSGGYHYLHVYIPRQSILKLHVNASHGNLTSEPRLTIYPKDRPQEKLAEAYTDLFLEADIEGEYIIRMNFSFPSGGSIPPCSKVQLHLVLLPKVSLPTCPWSFNQNPPLRREALKAKAEAHIRQTLDPSIFLPKRIAPHRLEVAAPRDVWLSPSAQPEISFAVDSPSASIRVEVVLHPPWLPLKILLFKRDNLGLRRTPEATSRLFQNRLLLLDSNIGPGDYVLQLRIYDETDLRTESLCSHATIHAEIGDIDEASVNALRAELLVLPDLMPIEPPPSSLNRRGWLPLPDVPVFSTSVFHFGETPPTSSSSSVQTSKSSSSSSLPEFSAVVRREGERNSSNSSASFTLFGNPSDSSSDAPQSVVLSSAKSSFSQILITKPTLLRIAAEPVVLSRDQLLLRVFVRKGVSNSVAPAVSNGVPVVSFSSSSPPGAVHPEGSNSPGERGVGGGVHTPLGEGETEDMTNYTLVEEAENSLLALLQPGAYRITYQAEEPFLITFGISSLDQLHRDLMYKPPVSSVAADDPGRLQAQVDFSSSSSCLSAPPALALPSPLPFYFESDIFDIKLHPSFLQKQGEIMTIPIQLTTPSVLYMETGSNFLLDFVKVGVKVAEGTWIGEQRSRVNFLRLILEPGTHYIKILNAHSKNTYHMEHEIKSEIDRERCLHFSLKIKSIAVNYAGERSDGSDGEGESSCFSYGAMSLPLDFHSSEGGSSALGGPIDANGRLLIRSKIVLTEGSAGGGGRKRVALDTRGRKLVVKLGVFSEDHERNVVVQVEDSHSLPVTPLYDWVTSDGSSEVLYELDGQTRKYNALDESSMFFLTFRIDKQGVPGMSSCVVFDLFLQVMPLEDKLNQMSMCPVGGGSVPVLTSEEFFPKTAVQVATERSSSHSTGLQQYISTQLTAIQEKKDGFLAEIPFTLTEESFILTDVQYNFFLSHVEVDLILDESKTRGQSVAVQRSSYHNGDGESISFGELDFINRGNHPLNARQWIATQLEPGHYILRIADDHYAKHFSSLSSSSCFPFKFSFQSFSLASRQTKPSIVGIHPDPSVPVKYGQDLLILIRLSTPPSVLGGETARRSAYLFGESGFTLYSTHFANLDSPDDEDARYLNEEEEEERKNGGETGHGGRRGGLVWSFLFTADKLQRLGNKAKFVLEFTTRQGGESYVLGVLPSGVYTPQAPQSVVTGIASDTSGATSNRDLGITYTFLSPGSLRENTPWSGTPGLISFASTSSTSSSPGSISSSSSQGGSAGGGGGDHMYDTRVERGPVSHEGDVQTTQGESAGIVKPETGMSDGRGREETRSEIVNELNRATSYGNEERRGEISPRPLIPPKAPRETLLVEEDEEDFSHEDRDGSDAYHPHSKHHHPTDERDRIHRGVYTPGTARGGEMMREHPEEEEEMSSALSVSHDPYNREDEDFHKEKIRRKLMRNAYDGGSHEEEEEEGDLGCPPGMRWREDLNECEEADDLSDESSLLLLFLASTVGIGGLLLLSRYVLRRRRKSGSARKSRWSDDYQYGRPRAGGSSSETYDFLHRRSSGSGGAGTRRHSSDNEEEDEDEEV